VQFHDGVVDRFEQRRGNADEIRRSRLFGADGRPDGVKEFDAKVGDSDVRPEVVRFNPAELYEGALHLADLCDWAGLNRDEITLMFLVARSIQLKWGERLQGKPGLNDLHATFWTNYDGSAPLLPLYPKLCRVLFIGGGSAGKTTLTNRVCISLVEAYYG